MVFGLLKRLLSRNGIEPKVNLIEILERLSEPERAFFVRELVYKGEIDKIPEPYIRGAIDHFGGAEGKLIPESHFGYAIPLAIKAGMLEMAVDLAAGEIGDRFKTGKPSIDERNVDAGVFHSILYSFGDKGKLIGLIPSLEERGFFYSAGKICEGSGLMERAIENYKRIGLFKDIGRVYQTQGKYELAREYFIKEIEKAEEEGRIDDALLDSEAMGLKDRLPGLFGKLIKKGGPMVPGGDFYDTSFALARAGMFDEALALMREIPNFKNTLKGNGFCKIAEIALEKENKEKAEESYRMALNEYRMGGHFLAVSKVSEILGDEENARFYQTINDLLE